MKILITLICALFISNISCAKSTKKMTESKKKASSAITKVKIETSAGDIFLELNEKQAPKTVANFKQYVKDDFYKGTIFHRVINSFMIQGGGFYGKNGNTKKATRKAIENEGEANKKYRNKLLAQGKIMPDEAINKRGTIAMARTGEPHSATAQFFINHKDNQFLDYKSSTQKGWGYTVFGKIVDGLDGEKSQKTLDKIATTKTQSDKPLKPIVIKKVSIIK